MLKEDIVNKIGVNIQKIVRKYDLNFLILFGSAARDKSRENSDIDIGVSGNLNFTEELQLAGKLSEILNSNHIDFINLSKAPAPISYFASREAILIYEKEKGAFADFRTYAFKKYVETKPLRDMDFKRTIDYVRQVSGQIA